MKYLIPGIIFALIAIFGFFKINTVQTHDSLDNLDVYFNAKESKLLINDIRIGWCEIDLKLVAVENKKSLGEKGLVPPSDGHSILTFEKFIKFEKINDFENFIKDKPYFKNAKNKVEAIAHIPTLRADGSVIIFEKAYHLPQGKNMIFINGAGEHGERIQIDSDGNTLTPFVFLVRNSEESPAQAFQFFYNPGWHKTLVPNKDMLGILGPSYLVSLIVVFVGISRLPLWFAIIAFTVAFLLNLLNSLGCFVMVMMPSGWSPKMPLNLSQICMLIFLCVGWFMWIFMLTWYLKNRRKNTA